MAFPLNDEQRAAASALAGGVLIGAGAGSGKTRTLSERFAVALEDSVEERWQAAAVDEVLAITFTSKAAGELAERIRSTLRASGRIVDARAVDSAWISTIHGLCTRILRRYAIEAGLDPSFGVAGTVDAEAMKEEAFESVATAALSSEDGAALLSDFEYDTVFDAVSAVCRELVTRALGAEQLTLPLVRPAKEIRREAIELLSSAAPQLLECGAGQKTAATLSERCVVTAATLARIDFDRIGPDQAAREVWRALCDWRPGRASAAIRDVHESLSETHVRLLGEAATAAAAPYTRAIAQMVAAQLTAYARIKAEKGVLDFEDLQLMTLELFESHPDVLAECRALFRMIMVDEFQDTDELQLRLVRSLAGGDLCTVGDEHQSIYAFRGADVAVYRRHNAGMISEGARQFRLSHNYRSHPDILGFVNAVFGHASLFGDDLLRLSAGREEPLTPPIPEGVPRVEIVLVHRTGTGEAVPRALEADAVARRFAGLRDDSGFGGGDMALLLRSYSHADVYAHALRRQGFEVLVVGGSRFLQSPEVQMARSLVRVIANPADEIALANVLASDLGRLSDDGMWLLTHPAVERRAGGLWEALSCPPRELGEADAERVESVRSVVTRARERIGRVPLAETILRALEECGVDLLLLADGDEGRQAYANLLKLTRMAAELEKSGLAGPEAFVKHLDAKERYRDHTPPATLGDDQSPAVRIMSVHSAKGLEFPVVAVVGMGARGRGDTKIVRTRPGSDGLRIATRMPTEGSASPPDVTRPTLFRELDAEAKEAEAAEAARLFYVACTRAREVLVLSGAADLGKPCSEERSDPLSLLRTAVPEIGDVPVGDTAVLKVGDTSVTVQALSGEPPDTVTTEPASEVVPAGESRVVLPVQEPACPATASSAPDRLSYSDIELYRRCEMRFWAQRVLRLGSLSITREGDPLRLGSAVHAVLQLVAGGVAPEAERIDAIARAFLLDEEQRRELDAAVSVFVASGTAQRLDAHAFVRREWPFTLRLANGSHPLDLVGTIDAYGRSDASGLIVDYKTGESGDASELRERYRLQAHCYALAAVADGCEDVTVVFTRPQVITESGEPQEVVFRVGAAEAAAVRSEILEVHQRMIRGRFPALKRWDIHTCSDCPASGVLCRLSRPRGG